jgi:signal transduction histidine kinase
LKDEQRARKIMKRKLAVLSQRYVTALRKHLKRGPRASLKPAHDLGRGAAADGFETLDIAKIHEGALATLEAASSRDGIIPRAEVFFAETITPIEKTHHAARKTNASLKQVARRLGRRTRDLAASNRSLKQSVARRKTVEAALRKSGGDSKKLLKESHRLQKHLRQLTRQILVAQEQKRKQLSRELQDEIAQTLLGINVRLLTLKKEGSVNARSFEKEIASTQRLVNEAGKRIKRFAREIVRHHEA